jgi:hypothetical protein
MVYPVNQCFFIRRFKTLWTISPRSFFKTALQDWSDGPSVPKLTHLIFADDNIVFLEATVKSFHALRKIVLNYEAASGQIFNLQKSSIFDGEGCSPERKEELKQAIGVKRSVSVI